MFSKRGILRSIWAGRIALLAILAELCLSPASRAIAPTPLPALSLQGLDGSAVSSTTWQLRGKSLVIYVRGNCRTCFALLGHLSKKDYPALPRHTTIIVSDVSAEEVKTWLHIYPDLTEATWYLDPSKAAATALHLQGAPVILGLKDNVVKWALSGEMQKTAQQKSVLNTWCKEKEVDSQMVRK
jgi:hypothetical protein